MKRIFKLVAICTLLMGVLIGCGSSVTVKSESLDYNIEEIYDALEEINPISNPRQIDDYSIETDFGIAKDDMVIEYVGSISNTMSNSGLILVIKTVDKKAADVETLLKTYKENQKSYFSNYPEFQDAMENVSNGIITVKGNYVVIVFANTEGANYEDINQVISDVLK